MKESSTVRFLGIELKFTLGRGGQMRKIKSCPGQQQKTLYRNWNSFGLRASRPIASNESGPILNACCDDIFVFIAQIKSLSCALSKNRPSRSLSWTLVFPWTRNLWASSRLNTNANEETQRCVHCCRANFSILRSDTWGFHAESSKTQQHRNPGDHRISCELNVMKKFWISSFIAPKFISKCLHCLFDAEFNRVRCALSS